MKATKQHQAPAPSELDGLAETHRGRSGRAGQGERCGQRGKEGRKDGPRLPQKWGAELAPDFLPPRGPGALPSSAPRRVATGH